MKNIWKIIAVSVAVGLMLSILGVFMGGFSRQIVWDRNGLRSVDKRNPNIISELDLDTISSIDVDASYANIEFIESDKYGFEIIYYNDIYNDGPVWSFENGRLKLGFSEGSVKMQILSMDFSFTGSRGKIKIYLPRGTELETVSLKTGSGDINIGGFNANKAIIHNSYGDVSLNGFSGGDLRIELDSGDFKGADIKAGDVVFNNRYGNGSIERLNTNSLKADITSGDFVMRDCSTGETEIKNSYGDVSLSGFISAGFKVELDSGRFTGIDIDARDVLLSNKYGNGSFEKLNTNSLKAFITSGDFEITDSSLGETEIANSYGDITTTGTSALNADILAASGDIDLNGDFSGDTFIRSDYGKTRVTTTKAKTLYSYDLSASYGKITIDNEKMGNDSRIINDIQLENSLTITATSGDIEVSFGR